MTENAIKKENERKWWTTISFLYILPKWVRPALEPTVVTSTFSQLAITHPPTPTPQTRVCLETHTLVCADIFQSLCVFSPQYFCCYELNLCPLKFRFSLVPLYAPSDTCAILQSHHVHVQLKESCEVTFPCLSCFVLQVLRYQNSGAPFIVQRLLKWSVFNSDLAAFSANMWHHRYLQIVSSVRVIESV